MGAARANEDLHMRGAVISSLVAGLLTLELIAAWGDC